MEDQARNMQRLVDDLLALSSLESEHNPVQDTEFAVGPLLLELSADAKALSHSEHAIAVDAGEPATILGNRDELESAIGNLVSNAIRYTPQRGAITIAWRIDGDGSGVFTVRDTGIGIAPEHIPRLTERFYRVDRSRSRATGGTGLGPGDRQARAARATRPSSSSRAGRERGACSRCGCRRGGSGAPNPRQALWSMAGKPGRWATGFRAPTMPTAHP